MKRGFTLIELLVVVLIIGILSAVALPQYTKAVERSRVAEAELMLRSLRDAQARCFLEHGNTCETGCCQGEDGKNLFDVMDIEINFPETEPLSGVCCGRKGKNFIYSLDGQYIYAERVRGNELLYNLETTAFYRENDWSFNTFTCYSEDQDNNICKDIGYTVYVSDGGVWKRP